MAAIATAPFISVEEYLHSVYEPDMDYVDGELEDRNVGEFDHAMLQRKLLLALIQGEKRGGYLVVQAVRMQVSATRFRVPDTCLVRSDRLPDRIIREAPLLCIEVLSPEDRMQRIQRRCKDYLAMGVAEVWIFDPEAESALVMRGSGLTQEHKTGTLRIESTAIELSLDDLFNAADVS